MTKKQLNKFHWHEALDRANMLNEMWVAHIEEHPVIKRSPALCKLAGQIGDMMAQLYQMVGSEDPQWGNQ